MARRHALLLDVLAAYLKALVSVHASRDRMTASVRLAIVALLAVARAAHTQSPTIAPVPVVTVTARRDLVRLLDTSTDVVVIVRDVNTPDRAIASAWLAIGPSGSDVRARPTRTAGTGPDGTARLAGLDSAALDVVVLRIGYAPVRFTIHLAPQCRQTVEVYISQSVVGIDAPFLPPTPARVVLTTCTPPV